MIAMSAIIPTTIQTIGFANIAAAAAHAAIAQATKAADQIPPIMPAAITKATPKATSAA